MPINEGDTVIIRECHHVPELVGRQAIVLKVGAPGKYPIIVQVVGDPVVTSTGPSDTFGFREDELQVD